jgi:hypothetical protein
MNARTGFALAFLVVIATSFSSAAGADAPNSFQARTAIDQAASDLSGVKQYLDSRSAGDIESAIFDLRGRLSEVDRQISDWESTDSRLRSEQSTVDRLRIEWETAKSQYDQEAELQRAEERRVQSRIDDENRAWPGLKAEDTALSQESARNAQDIRDYNAAVAAYNQSNPQSPAEQARLAAWRERGLIWDADLARRIADHAARWRAVNDRVGDWQRQLDLIRNGAKLLEKRIALSAKERAYIDARSALERQQFSQESIAQSINGTLETLAGSAAALSSSLASVRPLAGGRTTSRTTYVPSSRPAAHLEPQATPAGDGPGDGPGHGPGDGPGDGPFRPFRPAPDPLARNTFLLPVDASGGPPGTGISPTDERIRAAVVRSTLGRFETAPVESAPASAAPATFDSTRLARSDLPIVGFGDIVGEGTTDAPLVDLSRPVDPGAYFSAADYRQAVKQEERFAALIPKLEAKLNEVQGWRAELYKHQGDLEELRQETVRNNVGNVLAAARVSSVAEKLSDSPRYQKVITPEVVDALAASEAAINGYLSVKEGWEAKEMREKAEKASDTATTALDQAMRMLPKDDPVRKWGEAAIKAQQVFGKGYFLHWREEDFRQQKKVRSDDEVAADRISTTLDIAGVIYPPAAVGVAIGNEITDWRLNKYYIEPAMEDMRAALSRNFDAEASLRRQLERARSFREEEERIIRAYNASPWRAANSLRSR